MDEKVLKLFTDVGPHAKEALDSYVSLQWAKFLAGYGIGFLIVIAVIIVAVVVIKSTDEDKHEK